MIDEKTAHLKLPLPHPDNLLEDDVERLRQALAGVDAKSEETDGIVATLGATLETVRQSAAEAAGKAAWAGVSGKPAVFPPAGHKASHASGGADALAPADIGAQPAGNYVLTEDTRLTDARTPKSHAADHRHGGVDEIATATPAANAIPKADASGKLNAWVDLEAGAGGATTLVLDADLDLTKDSPKKMNVSASAPGLRIRLPQPADLEEDGVSFVVVNSGSEGIQVIDAFGNPLGADAGFIRSGQARAFVLVSTQAGLWAVLNLASATVGGGYDQGLTIEKGAPVVFASTRTRDGSSTLLSDNKILATYTDDTNNYLGMAVVITIFGSNITVGEPVVFNNAKTYGKTVLTLSPDKALVAYYSEGSTSLAGCNALVLNVTGTTISLGPKYKLSSSGHSTDKISGIAVSAGSVLIIYTGVNNAYGQMALLSITESSISSVSTGKLSGLYTGYAEIVRLNADKFVIIYNNNSASNVGSICPLTIDAENQSIILGNTVNIFKESISHVSAIALSSDKILLAYYSSSTKGTAVVLTISDTDIVVGNPVTFDDKGVSQISLVFLSENKALVAYNSNSTGKATLLTIYGTTINVGNSIVFTSGSTNYISGFALSEDKAVVTYSDNGNGAYGTSVILSFEGRTLTALPAVMFYSGIVRQTYSSSAIIASTVLSGGVILVAYIDYLDKKCIGKVLAISVTGTEITVGNPVVFNNASTKDIYLVHMFTNKAVIAYCNIGYNNYGYVRLLSVSGTTISVGTPYNYIQEGAYTESLNVLSPDKIFLTRMSSEAQGGYSNILSVTESSAFANVVTSPWMNANNQTDISSAVLSSDKILIGCNGKDRSGVLTLLVNPLDTTRKAYDVPLNATQTRIRSIVALSADKALVVYDDVAWKAQKAVIVSISGTSISLGSPVVFNNASSGSASAVALSEDKAIIAYQDGENGGKGMAKLYTIEGDTLTLLNSVIFSEGANEIVPVVLSDTKILINYRVTANNYGATSLILRR